MNKFGTVEAKIHKIVSESFSDCEYMFADYSRGNIALDKVVKPTILYLLPPSGYIHWYRNTIKDYPETQIWFLCPADFDFEGEENDCRIEMMKRLAYKFIYALNESGLFEPLEGDIEYQIGYDTFDDNLTGICITPELKEKEGLPVCDGSFSRVGWDKED